MYKSLFDSLETGLLRALDCIVTYCCHTFKYLCWAISVYHNYIDCAVNHIAQVIIIERLGYRKECKLS